MVNIDSGILNLNINPLGGLLLYGFVFILIIVGVLLINLILFIISAIKHKIRLEDTYKEAYKDYKKHFNVILEHYFPAIIIFILIEVLFYVDIKIPGFSQAGIVIFLMIFGILYYFFLDFSLAKSYYRDEFEFTYLTFGQIVKLVVLSIIYLILMIVTFPLLFPTIFLYYLFPFIRYPIIGENIGIFASLKRALSVLKKEFWDVFFYSSIYTALIGTGSKIPIIGVFIFTLFVQPINTMVFTRIYKKISLDYLKPENPDLLEYVRNMRAEGYSDNLIKEALIKAGYKENYVQNYFVK